jgi:hypothetical protein
MCGGRPVWIAASGRRHVNKLLELQLLKKYQLDDYGLTPEGYELANMLIEEAY